MILIEPQKKYNKKEIMELLEYNSKQLQEAITKKLLVFTDETMYGVYFFQFLKNNSKQLEIIQLTS
jgi:hypothetical protein